MAINLYFIMIGWSKKVSTSTTKKLYPSLLNQTGFVYACVCSWNTLTDKEHQNQLTENGPLKYSWFMSVSVWGSKQGKKSVLLLKLFRWKYLYKHLNVFFIQILKKYTNVQLDFIWPWFHFSTQHCWKTFCLLSTSFKGSMHPSSL